MNKPRKQTVHTDSNTDLIKPTNKQGNKDTDSNTDLIKQANKPNKQRHGQQLILALLNKATMSRKQRHGQTRL